MSARKIEDLVSLNKLESTLRSIAKAAEINLCMIDILGNVIIHPTNDTTFCSEARKDEKIKKTCLICATHAALESARQKRPFFYRCTFGLIDFALPVFYKDEVLGAICGGQIKSQNADDFLHFSYHIQPIDDKPKLVKLLDEMPIVNSEKLLSVSELLLKMTENLMAFGLRVDLENNVNLGAYTMHKLNPALEYISKNYNKGISLHTLAELCFVSESYFSRLFSATMGINVSQYITTLRIEKAKVLLENPTIKISAIAYEVGYNDCAYFIRKFKEQTEMTPLEYRAAACKK